MYDVLLFPLTSKNMLSLRNMNSILVRLLFRMQSYVFILLQSLYVLSQCVSRPQNKSIIVDIQILKDVCQLYWIRQVNTVCETR